jgi:hypothetical protein
MSCEKLGEVDRHFVERLGPTAERELRVHLGTCADCRDRYQRQLLLAALSPRVASAQARLKRGIAFSGGSPRPGWLFAAGTAMAAAALLFYARPQPAGFVARGGQLAAVSPELQLFRVGADGKPERVRGVLSRKDEVGFAYRNPRGAKYLLVFAADEHGRLYWYHPAWTDEATDPTAIAIAGGEDMHELPTVTTQDFSGQRLRFAAVFLDHPLSVKAVEAMARRDAPAPPQIPGAFVTDVEVRVEP